MRHAAAVPHAVADVERPLTDRGREAAVEAGAFLRRIEVLPDHVLVSPAARCVQTWEALRESVGGGAEVQADVNPALYAAAPEALVEQMRLVPESARTVLLIGHNPAVAYLASVLADADGPMAVMQQLLNGLRPGALAVYVPTVPWSSLDMLGARLTHFHEPGA